MNAAHVHLLVVHLPLILAPLAAGLLAWAGWRERDDALKFGYALLIVAALASTVAFVTGPWAFEVVKARLEPDRLLVEDHAVIGRAAFIVTVLVGVLALQALLQFAQEEPPPRWLRRVLLGGLLVACYLLAWSAHLGGQLSHPEIREGASWLFPRLTSS